MGRQKFAGVGHERDVARSFRQDLMRPEDKSQNHHGGNRDLFRLYFGTRLCRYRNFKQKRQVSFLRSRLVGEGAVGVEASTFPTPVRLTRCINFHSL